MQLIDIIIILKWVIASKCWQRVWNWRRSRWNSSLRSFSAALRCVSGDTWLLYSDGILFNTEVHWFYQSIEMVGRSFVFLAVIYITNLPHSNSLAKRPFWSFLSGGASSIDNTDQEIVFSSRNNGEGFIPTIRRTTASDNMPYAPLPLEEKETSEAYLSEVILLYPTLHSIAK